MKTNYIYLFIIFAISGLLAGYLYSNASKHDYTWDSSYINFTPQKFKPEAEEREGEEVSDEENEEENKQEDTEEVNENTTNNSNDVMTNKNQDTEVIETKVQEEASAAKAYVAGGCFWCVEADAEKLNGVSEAVSGYSGGNQENPTYKNHADHRETVEITYNPQVVSYREVLMQYMTHHDPTDAGGSFGDRGHSYSSAIYYQNDTEKKEAESLIQELNQTGVYDKPIVTSLEQLKTFTVAEDYHQDYYKKNPIRYNGYRYASGRTTYVKDIEEDFAELDDAVSSKESQSSKEETEPWVSYVKPESSVLKVALTELAYKVTQKEGTEAPYTQGSYDDNHEAGIYVDILSGEPLYSSTKKFDSGTGWPSFTEPISDEFIVKKTDYKLVWPRTEIRSKYGDNHIGHVFTDGPDEAGGLRYCMNGVALLFVPQDEMTQEGYSEYLYLFN